MPPLHGLWVSVLGWQGKEVCTHSIPASSSTESCLLQALNTKWWQAGWCRQCPSPPSLTEVAPWWGCCGGDAGASWPHSSAAVPMLRRTNFLFLLLRLFKNTSSQSRRRETAGPGLGALGRPFLVHNDRKALLWVLQDLGGLVLI